jgi:hypothetical protein
MRLTTWLLCIGLIITSSVSLLAAGISQTPKVAGSYSFASDYDASGPTAVTTADDWTSDGMAITNIIWWGSCWLAIAPGFDTVYSDGLNGAGTAGISGFAIAIIADEAPTTTMPYHHPASVPLATWTVPIGAVNQSPAFTVTKQTTPLVTEDVWQYSVDLSNPLVAGPTTQNWQNGTRYWLAITANLNDPNRQWGWHEGDGHWGAYATQSVQAGVAAWYIPCGGHDMAFQLTTIPEPGSLLAVMSGLVGILGYVSRMRRG